MKTKTCLTVIVILLTGCQVSEKPKGVNDKLYATLWMQRSAEYRALCYQAYQWAEERVEQILDTIQSDEPLAVIADIDETVLDNTPSEAKNILESVPYSQERWMDWTRLEQAGSVPGSLDFARFLEERSIDLFYISNRSVEETKQTLNNLNKLGYPYADSAHLLLKESTSSKIDRRKKVDDQYQIILLLGDNLADFDEIFEDRLHEFGFPVTDSLREYFGRRFIVLPNPIYGNWTKPLSGDKKEWLIQ